MNSFDHAYVLRHEAQDDGVIHYYICYLDGQNAAREIEITKAVYDIYLASNREIKRHQNFIDRHIEHSELSDESLHTRARHSSRSVEDIVQNRELAERLQRAIDGLPAIQRRRFILYYEYGLTYKQIAEIERCHISAVGFSIEKAKKYLKKLL